MARRPNENNLHIRFDGKLVEGLEPGVEELMAHRDKIEQQIYETLIAEARQHMLRGKGFVVIDPANPVWNGEELTEEDLQQAIDAAGHVAYNSRAGYAIVYAPVQIVRPQRPVVTTEPTALMKKLSNKVSAIAAGSETSDVNPS